MMRVSHPRPIYELLTENFLSVVTIVDAQDEEFQLPQDVNCLNRFNTFDGPIPPSSIVMVAFLTNKYRSDLHPDETNISHNVQWVAVLKAAAW
jgi:hypothetical protein